MNKKICSCIKCDRPHYGLGYCQKHYRHFRDYGDPLATRAPGLMTDRDYIAHSTEPQSNGCIYWTKSVGANGYGQVCRNGISTPAHRWMYARVKGPIPKGMDIRHTCDNRQCVNPEHLLVGTRADNNADTSKRDRNGNALLTNDDATEIRRRWKNGESQVSIGRDYNVSRHVIYSVVHYRTYKYAESA